MKKYLLFISVIITFTGGYNLKAEEYIVKGLYQGIDLYVINPMLDDEGYTYCVTEIFINNNVYEDVLNSSAFCISLSKLDLKVGDGLEIRFVHSNDCAPKIINPEVLKPITTFTVTAINITGNVLNFSTTGETSKIPFQVEQFRWNRWITVATVEGKGGPGENTYTAAILPSSGENRYRVIQKDHLYRTRFSDEYLYTNTQEPVVVTSKLKKVKTEITLSAASMYYVVNSFGATVLEGSGEAIDVSSLPKGKYILAYDATSVGFTKK
ncbi:MAG: hypothetical protein KBB11_08440 [Bacteroidales bacterium]|nr:hypothetical protein [Bacteroidales bacterium]HOY38990.1 hypothetical protein [Bacteroidales bacterium]HQP03459.1 hypothetical protein [Bacteroidales bacterium]